MKKTWKKEAVLKVQTNGDRVSEEPGAAQMSRQRESARHAPVLRGQVHGALLLLLLLRLLLRLNERFHRSPGDSCCEATAIVQIRRGSGTRSRLLRLRRGLGHTRVERLLERVVDLERHLQIFSRSIAIQHKNRTSSSDSGKCRLDSSLVIEPLLVASCRLPPWMMRHALWLVALSWLVRRAAAARKTPRHSSFAPFASRRPPVQCAPRVLPVPMGLQLPRTRTSCTSSTQVRKRAVKFRLA